jgi:hypothetical protein
MHKIHQSLLPLAVDVNLIDYLPGNPHRGNVEAVAEMLDRFGQLKPIVLRPNGDRFIVIAGNTTLRAVRERLGWTEIAGVAEDMDPAKAMMFAIGDNRSSQLGDDDPILLQEAIESVVEDYYDTLEILGWDDFELASMEEHVETISVERERGYTPPEIVSPRPIQETPQLKSTPSHIDAPEGSDTEDMVRRGASNEHSRAKAVVQYVLVFDDAEQQRRWYDFLKWLRSDPGIDGETASERLIMFLEGVADF